MCKRNNNKGGEKDWGGENREEGKQRPIKQKGGVLKKTFEEEGM